MIEVKSFTFNAFQENTYVVVDQESKQCLIFDPGCSNESEVARLIAFLDEKNLTPMKLINTHCHIDHVLGNKAISEKYDLILEAHKDEVPILESCAMVSKMYGIQYDTSPSINNFLDEGELIRLNSLSLSTILVPGHSPGSLCFYSASEKFLIGGDVLFYGSIGRTDLPGGNHGDLIRNIKSKLFGLPDDVVVYPGHGPNTTIGFEKSNNPFLS